MIDLEIENLTKLEAEFKRIGLAPGQVIEVAVKAAAEVIRDQAEKNRGGPIEKKLTKAKEDYAEAAVGPDNAHWYYRFFEFGAQPHEIGVSTKKALKLSEDRYAHRIAHHPGMAAEPFLRPAADEKENEARDAAGEVYLKAIKKAKGGL